MDVRPYSALAGRAIDFNHDWCPPESQRFLALLASLMVAASAGCAHRFGSAKMSEPSKRLHAEAAAVKSVDFEEDYISARLLYRALPRHASERPALRQKLVTYLLAPVGTIDPRSFRERGGGGAGANDDLDRIMASFREALDLYAPEDLWERAGPSCPTPERSLLTRTANMVATVFAPRGAEVEVATALLVLQTLEPKNRVWSDRLAELVPWLETGAPAGADRGRAARGAHPDRRAGVDRQRLGRPQRGRTAVRGLPAPAGTAVDPAAAAAGGGAEPRRHRRAAAGG